MIRKFTLLIFTCTVLTYCNQLLAHPHRYLTLSEVETIALKMAPEVFELQNKQKSFDEAAVAASQWADPQLMAGAINVPTDTFSFDQENMTQIKLGVTQMLPKGNSLQFKSEKQQMMSLFSRRMNQNTKANILRIIRNEWLSLYYWRKAERIIDENRAVFRHLVKVTESILSSGKNNQHDVLRAQLELSEIENREIQILEEIGKAKARLARWIGSVNSEKVCPNTLPKWGPTPILKQISNNIAQHPLLTSNDALIEASKRDIKLSEEDYKPGLMLGVNYGIRQGHTGMNNQRRTDLFSAQITMDLPIFTSKRQDKQLASKVALFHASKDKRMQAYRDMQSHLAAEYVRWQKLNKQASLYRRRLIPEARRYRQATLNAYQNHQSDYPAVAKAHVTELNTKLQGLKVEVERSKSRVELLYLQGNYK